MGSNDTVKQLRGYPWQTSFIEQHSSSALLLQLGVAGLSLQRARTNSANLLQLHSALSETRALS